MDQQQDYGTAPAATSSFRPDIQGLRAVAVLIVVLYHVGLVTGGYIGVDVFFVISGFLMGGLLMREATETGRVRLWNFFSRRGRRLLPALALTTVATLLLASTLGPFGEVLDATTSTARATSTFFANLRLYNLSGNYFAGATESNPLLHTWSLSVEEQFYFGLPALLGAVCLLCIGRRRFIKPWFVAALSAVSIVSLVVNVLMVNGHWRVHGIWRPQQFAFFHPIARVWEFAAGVLLAAWASRTVRTQASPTTSAARRVAPALAGIAIISLIAGTVMFGKGTAFPGYAAVLPVAAAVLLLQFGRELAPLRWLLECRPAVWLGNLSYGWYLWHWPLIVIARYRWGNNRLALCLAAIVALALALGTYHGVEEPFRRNKRIRGVWAATLIIVCVGVPFGVARLVSRANLSEWTEQHRTYLLGPNPAVQPNEPSAAANGGRLQVHYSPSGPDAANAPRVVLLGDSHARGMTKAFGDLFAPGGVEFESAFKNGCNFLIGPTSDPDACLTWQKRNLEKLLADPPDAVILAGYVTGRVTGVKRGLPSWFGVHDEQGNRAETPERAMALYELGLRNVVETLNKLGTTVIVISSEPDYVHGPFDDTSLLDQLRNSVRPGNFRQSLEAARERTAGVLAIERRIAKAAERMIVIDPIPLLCGADCSQWVDGELLYLDNDHLTYAGAKRLAEALLPVLQGLRS